LARGQLIEKIGQLGAKRLFHNGVDSEVVQEPAFIWRQGPGPIAKIQGTSDAIRGRQIDDVRVAI